MAETKGYITLQEENGTINIAEDVIATIALGSVSEVEGVSGVLTGMGGNVGDLSSKKSAQKCLKGVKLEMDGETLNVDVDISVAYGHAIPTVAENVQNAVISSVEAATGCHVDTVNVHVGAVTMN